jgi:hypothetical protein
MLTLWPGRMYVSSRRHILLIWSNSSLDIPTSYGLPQSVFTFMHPYFVLHTNQIFFSFTQCGRALGRNQPWRRRCQRSYMTHGHMETQFFLYHPSVKFGDIPAVEIRYPPYLDTMPLSYGPEVIYAILMYMRLSLM